MTNKAYIVANEQQEREVLEQLEKEVFMWIDHTNKPTEFVPSIEVSKQFPYAIVVDMNISLKLSNYFEHYEIVFDGRKEEKMSDKYVVSQEFMNELEEWKETYITDTLDEKYHYASAGDLNHLPGMIKDWWIELNKPTETNNRLIAIIRWVNGENVFEVEKPKKWVVRSKETDSTGKYHYSILSHFSDLPSMDYYFVYEKDDATKFDTREEAESWANAHQEVIEVN